LFTSHVLDLAALVGNADIFWIRICN